MMKDKNLKMFVIIDENIFTSLVDKGDAHLKYGLLIHA